jgi:hypothetical protein
MLLLIDRLAGPNCSIADRWCARAVAAATVICVVACGAPSTPTPDSAAPSNTSVRVDPARIDRARDELPDGYETADLAGRVTPAGLWSYGAEWSVDPQRCAALADPAGGATSTGWSASGPGGIVYAVIAAAPGDVDPAVVGGCARWTITGGRTTGTVTLMPAPAIEGG